MTEVLDASALVALVREEPAAAEVEEVLRRGEAAIAAINLAEAIDALGRGYGIPESDLLQTFGPAAGTAFRIHPTDQHAALRAASLRRRYYHRARRPLSLADCCCLAAANEPGDAVVTSDRPLLEAARREHVAVVALTDSPGRRA